MIWIIHSDCILYATYKNPAFQPYEDQASIGRDGLMGRPRMSMSCGGLITNRPNHFERSKSSERIKIDFKTIECLLNKLFRSIIHPTPYITGIFYAELTKIGTKNLLNRLWKSCKICIYYQYRQWTWVLRLNTFRFDFEPSFDLNKHEKVN